MPSMNEPRETWDRITGDGEAQSKALVLLKRQGVTFQTFLKCGSPAVAQGVTNKNYWEINNNAAPLIVLPVYDGPVPSIYWPVDDPVLCDLVAWRQNDPHNWHFLVGDYPAFLGQFWADDAAFVHDNITLYSTPLDWLRGDGSGSVVLDWDLARPDFLQMGGIVTENMSLGERALSCLRQPEPNLPEVSVLMGAS